MFASITSGRTSGRSGERDRTASLYARMALRPASIRLSGALRASAAKAANATTSVIRCTARHYGDTPVYSHFTSHGGKGLSKGNPPLRRLDRKGRGRKVRKRPLLTRRLQTLSVRFGPLARPPLGDRHRQRHRQAERRAERAEGAEIALHHFQPPIGKPRQRRQRAVGDRRRSWPRAPAPSPMSERVIGE